MSMVKPKINFHFVDNKVFYSNIQIRSDESVIQYKQSFLIENMSCFDQYFHTFCYLRTQIFNMWFPEKIFIYPDTKNLVSQTFSTSPPTTASWTCVLHLQLPKIIALVFESHRCFNLINSFFVTSISLSRLSLEHRKLVSSANEMHFISSDPLQMSLIYNKIILDPKCFLEGCYRSLWIAFICIHPVGQIAVCC